MKLFPSKKFKKLLLLLFLPIFSLSTYGVDREEFKNNSLQNINNNYEIYGNNKDYEKDEEGKVKLGTICMTDSNIYLHNEKNHPSRLVFMEKVEDRIDLYFAELRKKRENTKLSNIHLFLNGSFYKGEEKSEEKFIVLQEEKFIVLKEEEIQGICNTFSIYDGHWQLMINEKTKVPLLSFIKKIVWKDENTDKLQDTFYTPIYNETKHKLLMILVDKQGKNPIKNQKDKYILLINYFSVQYGKGSPKYSIVYVDMDNSLVTNHCNSNGEKDNFSLKEILDIINQPHNH